MIRVQIPHSTSLHRTVSGDQFADAVKDPGFVEGKFVLVVNNASKIPGFTNNMDRLKLDSHDAFDYFVSQYPGRIDVRRHNTDWTVRWVYFIQKNVNYTEDPVTFSDQFLNVRCF